MAYREGSSKNQLQGYLVRRGQVSGGSEQLGRNQCLSSGISRSTYQGTGGRWAPGVVLTRCWVG